MEAFRKVVRIGTSETYGGRRYSVYCKIEYDENGRFTISGVEGPLANGRWLGGCGQINAHDWNIVKYAPGWNESKEMEFRKIWERWHLNDLTLMCEHQRARGETYPTHPNAICPECGYAPGTQSLFEDVPDNVLRWLQDLPDADRVPAWVSLT